ncbi:hypothetical protein DFQ26_002981 [Actinomortierella ambigua]|nr:hypothetical protein DFQ26_002981 [Actinomortierella ambigua]
MSKSPSPFSRTVHIEQTEAAFTYGFGAPMFRGSNPQLAVREQFEVLVYRLDIKSAILDNVSDEMGVHFGTAANYFKSRITSICSLTPRFKWPDNFIT